MIRFTSRAATLAVALACLVWPLAPALALPCIANAVVKCPHCPRSKAKARAVATPKPRCCLVKATGKPVPPATVRPSPGIDLAPAPALPVLVAVQQELPPAPREPKAAPPRVLQRTHPLLR